jgi:hypothetical protein
MRRFDPDPRLQSFQLHTSHTKKVPREHCGDFCGDSLLLWANAHSLWPSLLPIKFTYLLDRVELLKALHRFRLVVLRWVSVAKHHLNSGVSEHGRQRYQVNTGHRGSCRPGVAKIIKPERGNLARLHRAVVRVIHLRYRAGLVRLAWKAIWAL